MIEPMQRILEWGKRHWKLLSALVLLGVLVAIAPTMYANISTKSKRYNLGDTHIPQRDVVIVFGAGVNPDGSPTEYLRNRIETAVDLYKAGKVKKILMSGDNGSRHYDEPTNMKRYAVGLDVPEDDVVVDYAGFNTYDTCYRASKIFEVNNAIVVTQGYHLPRAVMTCQKLGIDTVGVAAKRQGRDFTVSYIMREYVSTAKATMQVTFKPAPTVLGQTEPIQY